MKYGANIWGKAGLFSLFVALFAQSFFVGADEVMPKKPTHYFNDYAQKISPATAREIDTKLEELERKTSSQIVVALFPKMQSDSSLEDYVHRIFQSWQIGQKDNNNGALLAIFIEDRKMRIETGYGLEGALPDIIAKRIISDVIAPQFKKGNFDEGIRAGVNAILQAIQGEYHGNGRTSGSSQKKPSVIYLFFWIVGLIIFYFLSRSLRRYSRPGRYLGGRLLVSSGSGWGGGGGGFSGGGFSGGGGSSGGGGASGGW